MGLTIDQELTEISDLALKIKANYEKRLKADKVAMLTEIQLEIEEYQYEDKYDAVKDDMTGWILAIEANKLIQEKINSLKEAKNG